MKDRELTVEVLKFWHFIEFFTPFNLNEITEKRSGTCDPRRVWAEELNTHRNQCLPWLSETKLKVLGGTPSKRYKYQLYLLPFNKNILTKISLQVFPLEKENSLRKLEFEEKFDDEGETCFASLSVDTEGQPDFDKMSISTLPWALGKLQQSDLTSFNHEYYRAQEKKLKSEIALLASHLRNPSSAYITDHVKAGVMTGLGIIALLDILKTWANFSPDDPAALVIDMSEDKSKKSSVAEIKQIENKSIQVQSSSDKAVLVVETQPTPVAKNENDTNQKETLQTAGQIDILNSFYIEDLEKVINSLSEKDNKILSAYIQGIEEDKKIDVCQKENSSYILDILQADYLKQGRWPLPADQYMSLMQQFAINTCFNAKEESSFFSVNGPPGTGKTTLFQEMIAENIVKRARVLSAFQTSRDAFKGERTINFSHHESQKIKLLDDRLTGFEMLVVSSNNAAVENISRELPLQRKIPEVYQKDCKYLEAVASKVSAEHGTDHVKPLDKTEKPWGLISVALGNAKNRYQFCERVFRVPEGEGKENVKNRMKRVEAGEYLNIWEWRRLHKPKKGLFAKAKEDFMAAEKALCHYREKIKVTYDLRNLQMKQQNLLVRLSEVNAACQKISTQKSALLLTLQQHRQFKPNLWQRLIRHQIARLYKTRLMTLTLEWDHLLGEEIRLKQASETLQLKYEKIKQEIARFQLCEKAEDIVLPPLEGNFESDEVQLRAFWQNEEVNHLRLQVFIMALKLHEAWLAEVLYGGFFGNMWAISFLLGGKTPIDKENEQYIWQSLFMWIPVVSSTFASVGRQFRHLGEKSLGWVFIDEAGQAIPQAAVGAIWRAKNCLVVGDPLQIEPVFTIPPNLIEGWAKQVLKVHYEKWLPTLASVQTLADDANAIGTFVQIDNKSQWIGSPLRVHRRCRDPMFSLANSIAYQGKMINARRDLISTTCNTALEKSFWFHIEGEVVDKQYVREQGKFLLELLIAISRDAQKFSELYIITPFKQVKRNLRKLIESSNNFKECFFRSSQADKKPSIKKWCSTRIGTVHTFQGKEASTVIVVLGADKKHQGAVNWASSKPNLLNVALTRAQNNIYFIGDYHLWSSKKYFSEVARALPCIDVIAMKNSARLAV